MNRTSQHSSNRIVHVKYVAVVLLLCIFSCSAFSQAVEKKSPPPERNTQVKEVDHSKEQPAVKRIRSERTPSNVQPTQRTYNSLARSKSSAKPVVRDVPKEIKDLEAQIKNAQMHPEAFTSADIEKMKHTLAIKRKELTDLKGSGE